MNANGDIRWGILSTADIGRSSFLPGLRAAGGGSAQVVGGRDLRRTRAFADSNGIPRAVEGYEAVLDDPAIDAVYIPLPNSLHADWSTRALRAGKAVLCEKPLCISLQQTDALLEEAMKHGVLLWEAFVFPFREHFRRIDEVLSTGEIGDLRAVEANFHFVLSERAENIRLSPELAGGALNDVGCYCIHFGTMILGSDPIEGAAIARTTPEGVDGSVDGVLRYDGGRTLHFSCGMEDHEDKSARLIGTEGLITVSNPYHPGAGDTIEIHAGGQVRREHPVGGEPSFSAALRHINAVLREEEAPRHLATVDSRKTAKGMQIARDSAGIR